MQKRGQAALEFLTSRGWAILILIVIIVALANLGVFRGHSTPNTCGVSAPIACVDVIVKNTPSPSPSYISNITIKVSNVNSLSIATYRSIKGNCNAATIITNPINVNGNNYIGLTCAQGTLNDKEQGEIDLIYSIVGTNSAHVTTLRFKASLEP